jgi:hypothetical protein
MSVVYCCTEAAAHKCYTVRLWHVLCVPISHSRYHLKGYMQPQDAFWCYQTISKHKADKLNKTKSIDIIFFIYKE